MTNIWTNLSTFVNASASLITLIWAITSFGLGTWFGHRLARRRDRRKEFNTIADPIRLFLEAELRRNPSENWSETKLIVNLHALAAHLPWRKQDAYQASVTEYLAMIDNLSYRDDRGIIIIPNATPEAWPVIKKLLTFTKHK